MMTVNQKAPALRTERIPKRQWTRTLIVIALLTARKLTQRGWGGLALAILERLVGLEPRLLTTRIRLARVALSIGDDAAAVNAIQPEFVDDMPKIRRHYCRIARIYMALEDFAAAEKYLLLAREASSDSPLVWRLFGEFHRLQGHVEEAVNSFAQVVSLESTKKLKIRALQDAATTLADAGRKDAEHLYHEILALEPNNSLAHYGIVDCRRRLDMTDPLIGTIQKLLIDPSLNAPQKSHLHYALGNIYDGCGDAGSAFAHWMIANQIRAKTSPPFDIAQKQALADARCKFFTREIIDNLSQYGCQEEFLVCVVGMPRSGTTLAEQIIGSHSQARPLGERNDFFRLARNLPKLLKTKARYPECCEKLSPKDIQQAWRAIQDRMLRIAGPGKRAITKLPEDFFEIGLIKILFPKTKFINIQRNTLDVGLSCFMQNFRHIPYSRDVETLAEAFKQYHQMMHHWRTVLLPSSLLEVTYEHLVSDPEKVLKNVCDFIGISFEQSCLQFHSQNRTVKTCSRWQVRQPIYQTSVNRSDRYREFLGPLIAICYNLPLTRNRPSDNTEATDGPIGLSHKVAATGGK